MKHKIFFILIFFSLHLSMLSQNMSRNKYIKTYKELAVKEMKRSGIPASITLAQGILESDNGNSTLARKANNHFGIKCHNSWKGKSIKHDDDKRNECFRKYNSVYDSYRDHTKFLTNTSRYDFLFRLKRADYKGWAKGLKNAGYATNKKYDQMLIEIIEENKLYLLDKGKFSIEENYTSDTDIFAFDINKNSVQLNNRIKYIVAKEGDSFFDLAKKMDMMPWEIYKYNDLPKDAKIQPGQKLYIQPKKKKAAKGNDFHITQESETMYTISQKYGVKLKNLYKMNLMREGAKLDVGTKLWLRKKKKFENVPTEVDTDEIKVIFDE